MFIKTDCSLRTELCCIQLRCTFSIMTIKLAILMLSFIPIKMKCNGANNKLYLCRTSLNKVKTYFT